MKRTLILTKDSTIVVDNLCKILKEAKVSLFLCGLKLYEISSVDCTQIKDLNNLCVRPTFACKQAKLGLDSRWSR